MENTIHKPYKTNDMKNGERKYLNKGGKHMNRNANPFARFGLQCEKSQMEPPLNNASTRNDAFNNSIVFY
jgi:hypothetical protein